MTEPAAPYSLDMPASITLPWPDDTSLNARLHWAKRKQLNEAAHLEGFTLARQARTEPLTPCAYRMRVTFYPPDKRRRDLDNMLSRCKQTIDGMCAAWGIDDSRIREIVLEWGITCGGYVTVTLARIKNPR